MTPLLNEYFELLEKHKKELKNENVLLLMQVGSFYETYEIDEPKMGCAKIISNILRIHLTKKNGNKLNSENNPWMSGFPTYVLGKHLAKLNDEGYTVAVYDQSTENKQIRVLKGIYNYIFRHENEDEIFTSNDRRLFGIVVERYREGTTRFKKYRYLISLSYVDLSSGEVYIYENDLEDYQRELQNLILYYSPPELLMNFKGFEDDDVQNILKTINNYGIKVIINNEDYTQEFQMGLLQDIYETKEDPIVLLGLERHYTIVNVLLMVLYYIKKHDPILATKLHKPKFINGIKNSMEFNRDAFLELNITSICERRKSYVNVARQKSLIDILSKGMSGLGKRVLNNILRRPSNDKEIINSRLNKIEYFINQQNEIIKEHRIPDLEWLLLKWKRRKLSYRLTGQFLSSIFEIYNNCHQYFKDNYENNEKINMLKEDIEKYFDIEKMQSEDINFIKESSFELLEFEKKKKNLEQVLSKIEEEFKEYFKLQSTPEGSYYLYSTIKKWETFQYKNEKNKLYEIQKNKTNVRLSFELLDKTSILYQNLNKEKENYVIKTFYSISENILLNYECIFEEIINKIGEMDCFVNLADFFKKSKYCKPELIENIENSYINVCELRHPIYEFIEKDKLFIPYTFELGEGNNNNSIGMLLYGMNSSGKSTLLKSLGSAIWLAQCGLYVPAKDFKHTNISSLFTKIGTYDNLFCGHSTFVAEMSELNYILRKSNNKSVILCDELTSGTETKSASGIVVSSLLHFVEQKIIFLFTTHLHIVSQIPEIKNNEKISIKHFKVISENFKSFLIEDIKIRYDRELYDGPGNDIYGIEIAKSLGLPENFVSRAFNFRQKVDIIINDDLNKYKASKYNKNLIISECEKCGSKNNLHTHHITPQKIFENNEIIHDKNGLYNLSVLCEKCHQKIHHDS